MIVRHAFDEAPDQNTFGTRGSTVLEPGAFAATTIIVSTEQLVSHRFTQSFRQDSSPECEVSRAFTVDES